MRVLGIALVTLTLSGCANMGFDSNVSPAGIKDYYKGSNVKLYGREELKAANYVSLGTVEGEACQVEANEPPPKDADARADIRRRAADMGANGILLDRCIRFEDMPGCIEQVLCSGQALVVNE
ncbi:Rcs stress response system protein RcsF [Oceanimonas doudoroffii]|uniref:Exopolysaccharide biosynthesis protein n=1 Tax=Oceanimonas doudoroffii TaxID=84158 RepID=A0A233REP7_9GAMM|nr:Rcs stress response system protein RcsF [Oceanimonas doudoroffii]OXY81875.1 exopolysaccharide biosynthesis protein [Oceanimonas doudoroffii]